MDDLVNRLRGGAKTTEAISIGGVPHDPRMLQAADEIESLRAALIAIRDGYGPNHLSKFSRNMAANALTKREADIHDP